MGWIRRFAGLGAVGLACGASSCSEDQVSPTPSAPPELEDTGSVGLELQLANGATLDTADYTVSGPGSFSRSGELDLRHSSTISTTLGGLPAGAGYTITISASTDAGVSCAGSAAFSVTAHATAVVVVQVVCREPARQGNATISGHINFCPVIDALGADLSEVNVGRKIALTASAHDADTGPSPIEYHWEATSGKFDSATSSSPVFTCTTAGTATVTVTAGDGNCSDTLSTTLTCSTPAFPPVKINEVESNGGTPGDWVELYNAGNTTVDLSGWVFRDNDDSHVYAIPVGTTIAPGAYYMLEEMAFGFGLGAADSARLYDDTGIAVVDSYSWMAHAASTYGRCPNGVGSFVPTTSSKNAANDCGSLDASTDGAADGGSLEAAPVEAAAETGTGTADAGPDGAVAISPWPGENMVTTVDGLNVFGQNMSGLTYQPAAGGAPPVLWAVQNNPSQLYRLVNDGTIWASSTADDWGTGKALRYTNGGGIPDSEGLTKAEWDQPFMYVSTERDNNVSGTSRLSVLRFDTSAAGTTLVATNDWNLTADLPTVGSNLGLEAITWVPDTYLVANHFVDESVGQPYDPSRYPNHGNGIFLVGMEANGVIYGYTLDHVGGGFQRVATISSGHIAVMDLAFDRDFNNLWAHCDNTCGNKVSVLQIDTDPLSTTFGKFRVRKFFDRPSTLPDTMNNEGITFAPESECVNHFRSYFWADDGQTGGHAIRRDSIPCGSFF